MLTLSPSNISFEFFPPKTLQGFEHLKETAQQLAKLKPGYFSVTYGAGGSTHTGTIQTVKMLQESTDVLVAPHLSCIGATEKEIEDSLLLYKNMGITQIVALRGDLPSGMGQTGGALSFASDLVKFIRKTTGDHFHIHVAAYPEVHPQAQSAHDDLLNFEKKVAAGADTAITQFFYNRDAYFYFVENCRKLGLSLPIVPGIMPITQYEKQKRFASLCGAEIPRWFCKCLETYSHDPEAAKAFGHHVVLHLCEKLIAGGAPGLHIYTLNQLESSLKLVEDLKKKDFIQTQISSACRDGCSDSLI